jgi:hypothetical protein
MGQQDIEAKVMVWQVTGPLPWERSATARSRVKKVQDDSARFQERFLLSFRNFLVAVGIKLKAQVVPQMGIGAL